MAAKWQRIRIPLPKDYSPIERLAIGQEMINEIRDRTAKGENKSGGSFPNYSSRYVHSPEFKAAGKSQGQINLRLSGDMLTALRILSHEPGSVLLGYEQGSEENAKADGNIRGTYGSSRENAAKKRDFLGISAQEKKKILSRFPLKQREESKLEAEKIVRSGVSAKKITGK